jgi:DNA-binding protein H-NS
MARAAVPDVIREKIHALQSKLEQIETQQRATRAAALGFVSEALERLGLTLQDVAAGLGSRRGRKAAGATGRGASRGKTGAKTSPKKQGKRGRPAKGAKVPAKYRSPNGESWSGRGKQPRWLAALVAEGRSPAEFLL